MDVLSCADSCLEGAIPSRLSRRFSLLVEVRR